MWGRSARLASGETFIPLSHNLQLFFFVDEGKKKLLHFLKWIWVQLNGKCDLEKRCSLCDDDDKTILYLFIHKSFISWKFFFYESKQNPNNISKQHHRISMNFQFKSKQKINWNSPLPLGDARSNQKEKLFRLLIGPLNDKTIKNESRSPSSRVSVTMVCGLLLHFNEISDVRCKKKRSTQKKKFLPLLRIGFA